MANLLEMSGLEHVEPHVFIRFMPIV